VTARTKYGSPAIPNREVAAHLEGRLALYQELVPRLERLGADLAD